MKLEIQLKLSKFDLFYLQSDLGVNAEREVVVDDVERQVVLAAIVGRRTFRVSIDLQDPTVHLQSVGGLKVGKNLGNGLVDVTSAPA